MKQRAGQNNRNLFLTIGPNSLIKQQPEGQMPKKEELQPAIDVGAPSENGTSLTRYENPTQELMLTPVLNLDTAKKRISELQEFVKFYLVEGEDFGTIPGVKKASLFKPGADKLCDIYGLADEYEITNRVEDWSKNLFDYEVKCRLLSKRTGDLVGTGMGSCNSFEGKYRWRDSQRICPNCGKPTIIKGKQEFGGGYICWKKEGKSDGCGAKFGDNDTTITSQPIGRIENDDIPTLKNTILKMAKKRSKIDCVLSVTRSSGIFTQDVEDWHIAEPNQPPATPPAKPISPLATPAPKPAAPKPTAPKPPAKPATVPKAEFPKEAAISPIEKKVKPNSVRIGEICKSTSSSSTNILVFIRKFLGANTDQELTEKIASIPAVLTVLERSIAQYGGPETRYAICEEPQAKKEVMSAMLQFYVEAQK
jgi:hypothetical protein